jgi:ABC-type transport system involved in cytochrome bd biosynthesis fused ATPase/permease subunit
MSLGAFTLFTVIGSLVWNIVLVTAGYLLADQWEKVLDVTEPFQTLVVALIGLLIVGLIVRKVLLVRRERAAEELAHPGVLQESLEEVIEDLEVQAELDPELRAKPHED